MALASSMKANAVLRSTPKATHHYSAVIAPRHLAGCSNFQQQFGQADNCSRLLLTANSSSLPLKRTARRIAAADVDSVTSAPSSGFAEGHVGPAKGLRAIVIGTGMAGLAAARIMADHFDEVVMLERDSLPFLPQGDEASAAQENPASSSSGSHLPDMASVMEARRGVPQFRQPHVMLGRGLDELEELFPGFKHDLQTAGAVPFLYPSHAHQFDHRYGVVPHKHTAITFYGATRALVETLTRFKFMEQNRSNVTLRSKSVVTGYTFNESKSAVTGVTLSDGSIVPGDLIIDASGRGSKAADWIAAAGYTAPELQVVNCETRYTTATYELDPDFLAKAAPTIAWSVAQFYPYTRSATILPIEGGKRWQMILAMKAGDKIELTDEAVMDYLESLLDKATANALRHAKRVTDLANYSRTGNYRRLYEKEDLPDGLVVLGDSACAFNPVYGQGMTVGILQAKALGAAVSQALGAATSSAGGGAALDLASRRAALSGVSQKQMRQLGDVLRFPWAVATGTDAPFLPDFKQSAVEAFISGYMDEVIQISAQDRAVYDEVVAVMHMRKDEKALLSPQMVYKVLAFKAGRWWQALTGGSTGTNSSTTANA